MRALAVALVGLLLTGCTLAATQMSADQLKEIAKVKDASVTCIIANTPYGKATALFVNLDRGVIPAGGITVDDACKVSLSTTAK